MQEDARVMAKGKGKSKKRQRGRNNKRFANRAMLGTFAGGVFGKLVERMLVDAIEGFVRPKHHKHGKDHAHDGEDVAARLLAALADGGPKPIAQLLADTRIGLSPLLGALHTLRDFRLINFVGAAGEETVEVTHSGCETVSVLRANHIRDEAAKMLE
jgi:hypothetical protein